MFYSAEAFLPNTSLASIPFFLIEKKSVSPTRRGPSPQAFFLSSFKRKGALPTACQYQDELLWKKSSLDSLNPFAQAGGRYFFLSRYGQAILWKIDYYDRSYQMASEDPADPEITNRVLTVVLASEY